ncbi:MAG: hypothetical protein HND55_00755 [Pseudomonadota bacterium]|nr:MAG: hypothetical protein HND55_00755 [Pseudomonadota bacterium]
MKPQEYESLVARVAQGITDSAAHLRKADIKLGATNKLIGASGFPHQVDVGIRVDTDIYLVECKRWKNKVGAEQILVLAARAKDVCEANPSHNVHCILAATQGFTRGAFRLAKHFDIQLEIIKSPHEFGMKIGNQIHVAQGDCVGLSDEATIEVRRNGKFI